MHFKMNLEIYKTQKVMNTVLSLGLSAACSVSPSHEILEVEMDLNPNLQNRFPQYPLNFDFNFGFPFNHTFIQFNNPKEIVKK